MPLSGLVIPTLKQKQSQSVFGPWSTLRIDAHSFGEFTIYKIDSMPITGGRPLQGLFFLRRDSSETKFG